MRQLCYNQIHLNALYDLQARTYADAIIQPARLENENKAVCEMIDRYQGEVKTVFIADRGYESYNIFAHAQEKSMFFLVRVKDILRKGGIVQSLLYKLPVDQHSFDETLTITLTRKQTKLIKDNPDKYRFIPQNVHFDYLDLESRLFYEMKFRIIQYAIGLINFHSKKLDFIKQEIWARLILYNFCEAITTRSLPCKSNRKNMHTYQLNYTRAIHICRYFLAIRKGVPPDVETLIGRELLPVRPGRSYPRKVKFQSAVSFLYRIA